ncbi:MAG: dephospho-CoA kinase [Elusimicrobia bacterium]|nr:dephospho-CoA kinase [Elusimicrobiota bacterium]
MINKINYKTRVIGLTGGIASGKTLVLNYFKKLGIKTISCDDIAKKVYYYTDVQVKIKKLFGTLNRKEIANIIFSNSRKRRQLEKIMHPKILKELNFQSSIFNLQSSIVVDVPLLYEAKIQNMFDKIIVVYCKKSQQIERLSKRDNISKKESLRRVNSQIVLIEKAKMADYIIDNSKEMLKTKKQVKRLKDELFKLGFSPI